MKIYNTYNRKKEKFQPLDENEIKMYVCGPTVYDFIHIGNARPVVFFDVVNRYFKHLGKKVNYVSNITDVDDKIINKAVAEGVSEIEVSEKYLAHYLESCRLLNALPVDAMPKVTESMTEIIHFIDQLVKDDFAYESNGDVYFRVNKADDYGRLSGKKIDDLIVGARVEQNHQKESPLDFTLWKKTETGITWPSPWGDGRPGWHTECVVMIDEAFGGQIDIHGGGSDLQFPHHENEIAQSCCANKHNIAKVWMHVGRLDLDGEKMSKSLGNVVRLNELLKETSMNVFRLFILSSHYRQPINFSYEALNISEKEWKKIEVAQKGIHRYLALNDGLSLESVSTDVLDKLSSDFYDAMNDDFNTANAIATLYGLVKESNKIVRQKTSLQEAKFALNLFDNILFVLGFSIENNHITEEDKRLITNWEQARADKNFKLADELREKLLERDLL